MTTNIQLSEKQKEIVFAENHAIYVKASAGSGKTRVLTKRIRYLLSQTKKRVLALTFTYKAQDEIKEQLHEIPAFEERVFVVNFKFLCASMLQNHGHLIGRKTTNVFENETHKLKLVEQAIKQSHYATYYKQQDKKNQIKFCHKVLNFISGKKRNFLYSEPDDNINKDLILVYDNYQDILRDQNAADVDDLVLLAHSLLINYPNIAGLYRRSFFAICVDEAQELNKAQYQFLVALANGDFTNIMMVGDPNQASIDSYSSPDYMNALFVRDFNPIIFELNENYRSSKAVLSAIKTVFSDAENIPGTVKEGIFEIQGLKDENYEAQWVVDKIKSLIALKNHSDIESDITYNKIAVLARNKYVFNALETEFIENKLPFYYKMMQSAIQFESDLMKIFEFALRIKVNPQDSLHKNRLLKRLKIKITDNNISLESIIPQVTDELNKQLITLVVRLSDDGTNIKPELESFRKSISIEDENDKMMIFNDINELLTHWHNYAKSTDNKSLHQFKNSMALGQTHPLAQHSGITLSTVHTMKGQEFDIVFIIGMDDETFPDYRAVRNGGIEMTQEKNNLYVAFTRVKRFLYVTWPQKRMMPWGDYKTRKLSRFLKDFND